MAKNHDGRHPGAACCETTDPTRSLDAEFFPGVPKSWGLTFMINEEQAPTGRPAGGLAWAGLYNTFFWIDPTNQVGGVFMSQLLPFVDTRTIQAFYDFEFGLLRRGIGVTPQTGSPLRRPVLNRRGVIDMRLKSEPY